MLSFRIATSDVLGFYKCPFFSLNPYIVIELSCETKQLHDRHT